MNVLVMYDKASLKVFKAMNTCGQVIQVSLMLDCWSFYNCVNSACDIVSLEPHCGVWIGIYYTCGVWTGIRGKENVWNFQLEFSCYLSGVGQSNQYLWQLNQWQNHLEKIGGCPWVQYSGL